MKNIILLAIVGVALFIWMVGYGFNFPNANGQTANLMGGNVGVEYDNTFFNISDVSIKYDDVWGPTMIGLIQNKDPFNTIEGVTLSVQMYDKNNHLIGVMKGDPQSSNILPNQKTAFEIQSGDEDIKNVDHVFIEILATDWGTPTPSSTPPTPSSTPYLGSETNRTFTDCYSDAAKRLYFDSSTVPTKLKLNVTDPEINKTITNICNFYHEKSGLWVNLTDYRYVNAVHPYAQEFYQKYNSTFPESFKQFLEYVYNPSGRPTIGIIGLNLTPDNSKQIGLNQTKGFLLTSFYKGSPADKIGLRGGSNTTTFNGREIDIGGDIILKIDNRTVTNITDIVDVTSEKQVGDKVHLTILRDNAIKELDPTLGETPSQQLPSAQFIDFSYTLPPQNTNSTNPEELYDECVHVAGKDQCDYLFRK